MQHLEDCCVAPRPNSAKRDGGGRARRMCRFQVSWPNQLALRWERLRSPGLFATDLSATRAHGYPASPIGQPHRTTKGELMMHLVEDGRAPWRV